MSIWIGSEWEVDADPNSGWVLTQHFYGVNPKTNKPRHTFRQRYYGNLQQVAKAIADLTGCAAVSAQTWETLDSAVQALAERLQQMTATTSASPST